MDRIFTRNIKYRRCNFMRELRNDARVSSASQRRVFLRFASLVSRYDQPAVLRALKNIRKNIPRVSSKRVLPFFFSSFSFFLYPDIKPREK